MSLGSLFHEISMDNPIPTVILLRGSTKPVNEVVF
jgi:hypothetical protein